MRNLPPLNIRYPFDPTGKSPDNLVRDELRQLPLVNKRILVPTMGAFYTDSLRVRNLERDLIKGKDYELVMLYHDATVETGKEVNIGIYFSNLDVIGEVYLTYQVVGGQFTGVWEAVQQYVNVLLVDPRQVRWDDVLNKPDFYVPKEHFHDINDVYGLNALIPFLEEIRDAIMRIRSNELRRYNTKLISITNAVNDTLSEIKELSKQQNDKISDITNELNIIKNSKIPKIVNDLDLAINEFRNKDREIESDINSLDRRLNMEESKSDQMNSLIQTNIGRISEINNNISDLTNRIASEEEKSLRFSNEINTINNNITNINNTIDTINDRISNTDNILSNLDRRLSIEESKSDELNVIARDAQSKSIENKNKIQEIDNDLEEVNRDVNGLKEKIKTNENNINDINLTLRNKADVVLNATQDYYRGYGRYNGFIAGKWNTAIPSIPKIPTSAKYVGERDFAGWEINNAGMVLSHISFGKGEHYIHSFVNNGNGSESNTEKIITDWGLMNDDKVQALLTNNNISESRIKYVDNVNGNDNTGDGTWQLPYRTFDKAYDSLNQSNKFGVIRLFEGQTHLIELTGSARVKYRIKLPGLVVEAYGPKTNRRMGYTPKPSKPYKTDLWNNISPPSIDTPAVLKIVDNGTFPGEHYVFDGFYNDFIMYIMGINMELTTSDANNNANNGLSLMGSLVNRYIYINYCKINLTKEHTYIMTSSWYGKTGSIFIDEYRTTDNQLELSVVGQGKIFKPLISGEKYGDNNYNYDGLSFYTSHLSRYTDEVLNRLIPGLKHGKLTWNSNINTNLRRNDKIDPDLIPISKEFGNALSLKNGELYIGDRTPSEYERLYVDAIDGSDDNPGTRDRPFRTIKRAIEVDKVGYRKISIYLKERQSHIVDRNITVFTETILFYIYGNELDEFASDPNRFRGGDTPSSTEFAYNLDTKVVFKPSGTFGSGNNKHIHNILFSCVKPSLFYFIGIKLEQHSHIYLYNAIKKVDSHGVNYKPSGYMSILNQDLSRLSINIRNSKLTFVNNTGLTESNTSKDEWNRYQRANILLSTVSQTGRGITKFSISTPREGGIDGDGIAVVGGLDRAIVSVRDLSPDKIRKYFPTVERGEYDTTSVYFSNNEVEHLPVKHKLNTFEEIILHSADDKNKAYTNSNLPTYKFAKIRYSYTDDTITFSKPVKNNRNQTLGLSGHSGNLLKLRDDGFYYGIEAPPDTSVVYVDAIDGSDDNPGTRDRPFRTLAKAWKIDIKSGVRTIYIKEEQDHIWNFNERYFVQDNISRKFYIYGPKNDELYRTMMGWSAESSKTRIDLNTRISIKPEFVYVENKITPKRKYTEETLFFVNRFNNINLSFSGITIIKHAHKYAQKASDKLIEDDYKWEFSDAVGIGYKHSGRIDVEFINCRFKFINDWIENPADHTYKHEIRNSLLAGQPGQKITLLGCHREGLFEGKGKFLHNIFPNINIISSNSISPEDIRKYFKNILNFSRGLYNVSVDDATMFNRNLPMHPELFRVNSRISFESADDYTKIYWGSTEDTYKKGEIQFSYLTDKFKFTKPVTNERNQVLGVSNAPNNLIKHNDSGLILTKQDLYNALVEMGLTPPRRPN